MGVFMFSTTVRRRCGLGAAALAGIAVLGACGTHPASARAGASPSVGAPFTSTAPAPTLSGTPNAAPSATATSTSHGSSGGTTAACLREHLTAGKVQAGAAAGTAGYTIQLTNHGSRTCTLSATPKLYYTTSAGTVHVIPVTPVPGVKPLALPAGRIAETNVLTVDGYGGYATDSPHCAHPVVYRGISIGVGDGRVALPHFELDVTCDGVRVSGWNFAQ
jgi:hypothetical protein